MTSMQSGPLHGGSAGYDPLLDTQCALDSRSRFEPAYNQSPLRSRRGIDARSTGLRKSPRTRDSHRPTFELQTTWMLPRFHGRCNPNSSNYTLVI